MPAYHEYLRTDNYLHADDAPATYFATKYLA